MNNNISPRSTEKGQTLILMVLAMVALLGFTALGIDGARIYSDRREAQSAADSAAMSAALAKCTSHDVTSAARTLAASNGFNNDGTNNTVTVNNPPASGAYAGNTKYIEVIITTQSDSGIASFIYKGSLKNTVRAVGRCINGGTASSPYGPNAIVTLNGTSTKATKMSGSVILTIDNGGMFTNSSNSEALYINGSYIINADSPISVVGGDKLVGSGTITPSPTTGVTPITDPLASLPPPPKPSGTCTDISLTGSNIQTLNPGLYCSISAVGSSILTLNPGIYWIESGSFKVAGSAIIHALGVMIYMGPNAYSGVTAIDMSGSGIMEISGPTSGTYKGMALYVDRANDKKVTFTGSGVSTSVAGTFYAPSSYMVNTGSFVSSAMYSQWIADTFDLNGSGVYTITYDPSKIYTTQNAPTVSLVE